MNHSYDYDLFVIGGGSGGLAAAKAARKLGKMVGIADYVKPSPQNTTWGLGGTCVNVGCIPKKLMHRVATNGETIKDLIESGWPIEEPKQLDWGQMMEKINTHIKKLNFGYRKQLMEMGIHYYRSLASLEEKHTVRLEDQNGKISYKTAQHILIAVGGRPNYMNIKGAKEFAQTSDDIFWSKKPFGKTLVIGSGYIALECGGFLSGLKKDVTILYREQFLRGFDQEIVSMVVENMKRHGVKFQQGALQEICKEGESLIARLKLKGNDQELLEQYDNIFMAIGRHPDTESLNIDLLGIQKDSKGKIIVNDQYQTNVESVFAIGDVRANSIELTPVAIKEGEYLVNGLFKNKWRKINYEIVPTTVFTPLEYSKCGLGEEDSIQRYGRENIEIYHQKFTPLEWNLSSHRDEDFSYIKVIVLKNNDQVIGIHFLGPDAGEVMQGYAVAMSVGVTYQQLQETIGIHPTSAEELVKKQQIKIDGEEAAVTQGC